MNNKDKKVILFSTRKIQEEGIFKSLTMCNPSDALKNYFQIGNSIDSVSDYNKDFNKRYDDWKKKIKDHRHFFRQENQDTIQTIITHGFPQTVLENVISLYEGVDEFLEEGKMLLNELREKEIQKDVPLGQLDLEQEYKENIDAIGRKTIADRISLFGFPNHEGEYAVYAVWPLIESCKDEKWVNALLDAALEQSPFCEEIILWLHDNDLTSTRESTFHVIYYQNTINNKKIKCSLGVFQHPDPEFNGILFIKPEEVIIYDTVNTLFSKINSMQLCNKSNVIANVYEEMTPKQNDKKN